MKRIIVLTFLLFATSIAMAQTAEEIVTKSENVFKGKTSIGTYEMQVVTPEYSREMKMEYWWDDENDRALIKTLAPKKEVGNKWLKIGNEMWNYLKATETTIKIPPLKSIQIEKANQMPYSFKSK